MVIITRSLRSGARLQWYYNNIVHGEIADRRRSRNKTVHLSSGRLSKRCDLPKSWCLNLEPARRRRRRREWLRRYTYSWCGCTSAKERERNLCILLESDKTVTRDYDYYYIIVCRDRSGIRKDRESAAYCYIFVFTRPPTTAPPAARMHL